MAFLDDITKKVSQVGQKTKDLTEVARLKGLISDEEKVVNKNYFQVGKLYVAMHSSDYESDFAGMISAIAESERKIKEYKQQIQDIKGVVHCEMCGAGSPINSAFCNTCGAPLPKSAPEGGVICGACGAVVMGNTRFCTSCGKPMVETAAPAPVADAPVQQQGQNSMYQSQERVCPGCNSPILEDTVFCTECGMKVG